MLLLQQSMLFCFFLISFNAFFLGIKKAKVFSSSPRYPNFGLPFSTIFMATSIVSFMPLHICSWKQVAQIFSSIIKLVAIKMINVISGFSWQNKVMHVGQFIVDSGYRIPRYTDAPSPHVKNRQHVVIDEDFLVFSCSDDSHVRHVVIDAEGVVNGTF